MNTTEITVIPPSSARLVAPGAQLPVVIADAGEAAYFAWEEFFTAGIPNRHTRTAYERAVRRFLDWIAPQQVPLTKITPGMVGRYVDQHPGSIPTKKLHLAAIRGLFDKLVTRHAMGLNPAASVRGERYKVMESKTPEISADQARKLLASIRTSKETTEIGETVALPVGLRDAAIIATLIYTAA